MDRAKKFLEQLYNEKEIHKEHRHKHLLYKLSFVLAIFGFGSLGLKIDILKPLIYLVPFVALCHDIYIFSEDYKVKRIGYFIKLLRNHNIEIDSIIFKNQLLYEIDDNISFIEGYWEI